MTTSTPASEPGDLDLDAIAAEAAAATAAAAGGGKPQKKRPSRRRSPMRTALPVLAALVFTTILQVFINGVAPTTYSGTGGSPPRKVSRSTVR